MALVTVRSKATGEIIRIPEHWVGDKKLGAPYEPVKKEKKSAAKKVADDSVNKEQK